MSVGGDRSSVEKATAHIGEVVLPSRQSLHDALRKPADELCELIDQAIAADAQQANATHVHDLEAMRVAGRDFRRRIANGFVEPHTADRLSGPEPATTTAQNRHDMRTPIATIIGYGELVMEEAEDQGNGFLPPLIDTALLLAKRILASIDNVAGARPRAASEPVVANLPAHASSGNSAMEMARALGEIEAFELPRQMGRILIVDDNEALIEPLSRRLLRDGHEVVACTSGERALELARAQAFDMVLLDVMMPGMSGVEVLRELKRYSRDLPVVMISALDELNMIVRCLAEGADDYLPKPVNTTLLRARIGSSLERKFLRDSEKAAQARLRAEQRRSDSLLRNILPNAIVERLRKGEAVKAEHFDDVSILFCDLVGFTRLTADWEPTRTVDVLNEIFSGFDDLVSCNRLEKIKTLGDGYMVAGGLLDKPAEPVAAIACLALAMQGVVAAVAARQSLSLACRIGISTGPVVAGIVGTQKFFYDVWGDTVNMASRMETSSLPGRIQVSKATHDALVANFSFEARGRVDIKGKGCVETFFLTSAIARNA